MPDIEITQKEADALIRLPKIPLDKKDWSYPPLGGSVSIPLISRNKHEDFLLDIRRGQIELMRGKYQTRARNIIVLARLDFGGPPHRNPDGEEVPCPHIHIYREGYGAKWAYLVSRNEFPNISSPTDSLYDFMRFCNIVEFPSIQFGLFS